MKDDPSTLFKDTCDLCALLDGLQRSSVVTQYAGESAYQTGTRRGSIGGFALGIVVGRSGREPPLCASHKSEVAKALRLYVETATQGNAKEDSEEAAARAAIDRQS